MKQMLTILAVGLLVGATTLPAQAAAPKNPPPPPEQAVAATQGDLARILVNALGLAGKVTDNTPAWRVLQDRNIQPPGGWRPGAKLELGDLAVILVQAMRLQGELARPNDPKACLDLLKRRGIDLSSLFAATRQVTPENFAPLPPLNSVVTLQFVEQVVAMQEFTSVAFRVDPLTKFKP